MDKINVKDIPEIIKNKRPTVKDNTIKQYTQNLKKLRELYDTDGYDFLNNPSDVLDKLKSKKYTSQRNTINAIIILLLALDQPEALINQYRDKRDAFNQQYQDAQATGIISDKQKDNFITLDELTGMVKQIDLDIKQQKLKKVVNMSSQQRDLLTGYTIYTMLLNYPTRNDMANMQLVSRSVFNKHKTDRSCNYLIAERGKLSMVLNCYKTAGNYGQKIIELNKPTEKVLRMYMKIEGIGLNDIIFKNAKGDAMTSNSITQLLIRLSQKYLNKSISSTMIRKIVVSNKFSALKKEQSEMANIMGHSVSTQNNVYVKDAGSQSFKPVQNS